MSGHAFIRGRYHKHEKYTACKEIRIKCTLLASRHWVNSNMLIDVYCAGYHQSASQADVFHHRF